MILLNKKISRTISIAAGTFLLASSLTSCFNPVFSSIRKEVELEEAQISGYINSIARFYNPADSQEYLYVQNGKIYYKQISDEEGNLTKNMTSGSWKKDKSAEDGLDYDYDSSSFSGYHFYKHASDEKYVYAIAYTPVYNDNYSRNVPSEITLFCSESVNSEWKKVTKVNEAIKNYINKLNEKKFMMDSSIHLFSTNAPQKEHRKAFIRIGGGDPYNSSDVNEEQYYGQQEQGNYGIIELSGPDTELTTIPAGTNGANYQTLSAIYIEDEDDDSENNIHFSNYVSAITNESRFEEATYVYYGDSDSKLLSYSVEDFKKSLTDKVEVYIRNFEDTEDGKANYQKQSFTISVYDSMVNSLYYKYNEDGELISPEFEASENDKSHTFLYGDLILTKSSGCDEEIRSIAVTKDSLILGTFEKGAYRLLLTDGKPADETSEFNTNADTIMTTPYIVRMLFSTDPSIGEEESGSALYSSMQFRYTQNTASADYNNVGLWSYYSSRGNWNRE